jgi:hypothetical protein
MFMRGVAQYNDRLRPGFNNWLKPDFSCRSSVNTACGAHASCSSMALALKIKPCDFEADHLPPSRGEVKNPRDFIFFLIAFMAHYLVSQSA